MKTLLKMQFIAKDDLLSLKNYRYWYNTPFICWDGLQDLWVLPEKLVNIDLYLSTKYVRGAIKIERLSVSGFIVINKKWYTVSRSLSNFIENQLGEHKIYYAWVEI